VISPALGKCNASEIGTTIVIGQRLTNCLCVLDNNAFRFQKVGKKLSNLPRALNSLQYDSGDFVWGVERSDGKCRMSWRVAVYSECGSQR